MRFRSPEERKEVAADSVGWEGASRLFGLGDMLQERPVLGSGGLCFLSCFMCSFSRPTECGKTSSSARRLCTEQRHRTGTYWTSPEHHVTPECLFNRATENKGGGEEKKETVVVGGGE